MRLRISIVLIFCFVLISCTYLNKNYAPSPVKENEKSANTIKPFFMAGDLAGKTSSGVDKVLGAPSSSRVDNADPSREMREYSLAADITAEFYNDKLEIVSVFFTQSQIASDMAYKLVGLNKNQPKPDRISEVTTGDNWIKIKYEI